MDWLGKIDVVSVAAAFSLAGLTVTAVILLLGRVGEWTRSLTWWAGSAVSMTLGFTMNILQVTLPSAMAISIGNPMAVAGACLFYIGLCHVVRQPVRTGLIVALVAASALGSMAFVLVWPSVVGRVFIQLACLSVVTTLNVSVLRVLDRGYYHFPARFLLVVNVLLMVFICLRGISVLLWGAPPSAVAPSPLNAVVYGISGMLILAYLAGILLICFAEKQTMLRALATEDSLTGVHNRLGLRDALNGWPKHQGGVVTVFDIDHFKRVNDGFGHEAGDILLRTFAQALRANAPAGAAIARLGGDEFCVVEPLPATASADQWIETVKQQLPTRLEIASPSTLSCKVSHGSARFASITGGFAEALREADRALYRSKAERVTVQPRAA
jgi:diguanylate cyclase (GGDEF)-like protein